MDPKNNLVIDFSSEEFQELRECMQSKFKTVVSVSLAASTAIAVTAPIKTAVHSFWKRIGVAAVSFITFKTLGYFYINLSCAPAMLKIVELNKKKENSLEQNRDTDKTLSDSHEIEPFDSISLPFTSDPDMNPPSSFGLGPGFKLNTMDEEKDITTIPESKTLTYEELRKRSRAEYQSRPNMARPTPRENKPEVKEDNDPWNSGSNTWKRKTNIYGDVLE